MKKLCGALMVLAMSGAVAPVWAAGSCWVAAPCATRVVYVQVPPVVYVSAYEPMRLCEPRCESRRFGARGAVYAPRVMAQPGYWVYRDLGCGRTQRAWQPSRRVSVPYHHGGHVAQSGW